MVNPDPPPSREGDPLIIVSEAPVIATTTVPQQVPPPSRRRPTPFQHLPGRLNQQLQQFSGFLTPFRNSIAPLFSGSGSPGPGVPPLGVPREIPQVSPDVPPSDLGLDSDSPTPFLDSQDPVSPSSSVDLSVLHEENLDWTPDDDDVLYFSRL